MTLNQFGQLTMKLALISSLGIASIAYASPVKKLEGVSYFSVPAGQVNCHQHNTDVCIVNNSSQTIYFSVPTLSQNGQLNPPQWADVYSNAYYNQLQVKVANANLKPIFNQSVSNHSIINVGNNTAMMAGSKLKVSVEN